jgi:short-subunit dehydrogenase
MDIHNKIIIVTGATQGIGRATAKLLAKEGATVVLVARSEKDLIDLEKELPGSFAVPTDLRSKADIQNLIDKTIEEFGRIDVLVNNAGQGMYGSFESINLPEYQKIIELNVYGPLLAMQAAIPQMKKQGGGVIVNVSSRVSKNYYPNLSAYASTKYALNALSLTARAELAKDHIVVSVMHPKMTATNFGGNSFGPHPDFTDASGARAHGMEIDAPEAVAEKICELIRSGDAESEM